MKTQNEEKQMLDEEQVFDIDLTDAEEARRAFIASEVFNKKY